MANLPLDRSPINDALKVAIRDATNNLVEIARSPVEDEDGIISLEQDDYPYTVIHPLDGRWFGGISTPYTSGIFQYQFDYYGLTRAQAEWLADKSRHVLLDRSTGSQYDYPISPIGMIVPERVPVVSPGRVRKEGKLFRVVEIFDLHVSTS